MIPPLVPSQDRVCAVCGRYETAMPQGEEHHVVKRSLGGMHGDTLPLCLECHNRVHAEDWRMTYEQGHLIVCDRNGELLVERHWGNINQADYIDGIHRVGALLYDNLDNVRLLDDDGLIAAAQAAAKLGKGSWLYLAECVYWARRRMPYGTEAEKVQALMAAFGLARPTVYEYLRLRDIPESIRVDMPVSVARIVARADDPQAAVELWETRRNEAETGERRGYTVREFQAETAGHTPVWHSCPECGQTHVMKEI